MTIKAFGHLTLAMVLPIALIGGAGLAMLSGWGTAIEWHPSTEPRAVHPQPMAIAAPAPTPLQSYSDIWNHSLFNQDRGADPAASVAKVEAAAPALTGLSLTGVVISPPLHKAFFKSSDGKSLSLSEGEALPNGWTVEKIESEKVSLTFNSARQDLLLPVLKLPDSALR